ncbi:MAG: hypothetical protein K6V73_10725 [Firmicutes bacterium]|nr:hypothetical protein [Bacillota bacterium]
MAAPSIDPAMAVGEILRRYPQTLEVFDRHGVTFCAGCFLTLFDPLEAVAGYHAVADVPGLLRDLERAAARPAGERPAWAQGSAPPPEPVGRPLDPEGERRVQERMALDPVAAQLGLRLLGVRRGSARAGVGARGGAWHAAVATALALFAAQAAHATWNEAPAAVLEVALAPLDLERSGAFLIAEAQRESAGGEGTTAYRVRLLGRGDAVVGVGTVLLTAVPSPSPA